MCEIQYYQQGDSLCLQQQIFFICEIWNPLKMWVSCQLLIIKEMQRCPTLLAGEVTCLCAGAKKGHRPHSLPYEETTAHIHKWCCVCQRCDTCWGVAPHGYWGWPSAELLCEHLLQSGCRMISSGVSSRTCLNLPQRLKRSSEGVQVYFPSIKHQISTEENTNHQAEIYPNCYL